MRHEIETLSLVVLWNRKLEKKNNSFCNIDSREIYARHLEGKGDGWFLCSVVGLTASCDWLVHMLRR